MVGETLSGIRLDEQLCVTTTGTLYRATDAILDVARAVKIIHPKMVSPVTRARFKAAIEFWAMLDHPNFVHIFSAIETNDTLGFVMELIQGHSLRQLITTQGKLSQTQAIDYFLQVAKALSFAHARNILHRKLSPENIVVRSDQSVKVLGLGALRHVCLERNITPTNLCIGKPKYMAPEQFQGRYSVQTDQYMWGAALYEVITGRPPFIADNLRNLLRMHCQERPISPKSLNPDISQEVEEIILKTLSKKPENRFPSMSKVIEALMTATDRVDSTEDISAQSLMFRGRHAMERRKIEHAAYYFNKVLSLYGVETPFAKEAQEKRSQAMYQFQEEQALRHVRDLYMETLAAFDNEEKAKVVQLVGQILEIIREFPNSTRIRGTKMDIAREMPDILAQVANAQDKTIEESNKIMTQGLKLFDEDQYEDAIGIFAQAVERDPKNLEAVRLQEVCMETLKTILVAQCYCSGQLALKNNDYSQAISFFEKVLELRRGHEQANSKLKLAREEESHQKSRKSKVAQLYQDGLALYEKWQFDEAIAQFAQVLDLDPEHPEAKSFVSQAQARLSEDTKTEEIGFFYQKGMNFYNNQKWREAIACFNHVLQEISTHKKALEYKKLAELSLQQQATHDRVLDEAMQLFRTSRYQEALERFNYLYQQDNNNQELARYRRLCQEFIQQNQPIGKS